MSKHQHLPPVHEEPDPWHAHTPDEGLPQEEHGAKANPVVLGVALVGSVVFLALVVLVIYIYFESFTTGLRAERLETTVLSRPQLDYRRQAAETMADYNVLPASAAPKGVITIPLDIAINEVIARYGESGGEQAGTPRQE